jgi:uncharacterized protein (TIGR02145 family)
MIYITAYPLTQRINPMRKLLLTTVAVAAAIGLAGCGNSDPDTLIDSRDGQKYRTVVIGGDRWMAQNLNYQTKRGSWCYDNNADNCKRYGRLYDWKAATTVCPKGWKLPSSEDWDRLVAAADGEEIASGKKLKSKNGWEENGNGTNDFGFSALPGGYRYYRDGGFNNAGYYGGWWTATEGNGDYAYLRDMNYYFDYVYEIYFYKSHGFSVRCVADRP